MAIVREGDPIIQDQFSLDQTQLITSSPIDLGHAREEPYTLFVSPSQLMCKFGRIVGRLSKALHTPGQNGNGKATGDTGAGAYLMTQGMTRVPHDFECVAFGKARVIGGNVQSTYLDSYVSTDISGNRIRRWVDAWHRPVQLGHLTEWEFDEDGYCDFLERCLKIVTPGKISDLQIRIATKSLIKQIEGLTDRDDARSRRMLAVCLLHLPPDLAPKKAKKAKK